MEISKEELDKAMNNNSKKELPKYLDKEYGINNALIEISVIVKINNLIKKPGVEIFAKLVRSFNFVCHNQISIKFYIPKVTKMFCNLIADILKMK